MTKQLTVLAFFILLASAPVCLAQKGDDKKVSPETEQEKAEREMVERGEAVFGKDFYRHQDVHVKLRLLGVTPAAKLPKGEGAWVVHVFTRGGVLGAGKGDVTVSSLGGVSRTAEGAAKEMKLAADALRPLSDAVALVATTGWEGASPLGACRDCYVTIMLVQRRESGGTTGSYLFQWDDVTLAKVPADVLRVHDAALALASAAKQ